MQLNDYEAIYKSMEKADEFVLEELKKIIPFISEIEILSKSRLSVICKMDNNYYELFSFHLKSKNSGALYIRYNKFFRDFNAALSEDNLELVKRLLIVYAFYHKVMVYGNIERS